MKSLSEALAETRAILRSYADDKQKGWSDKATLFLQELRNPISTHDELRSRISSFAEELSWGVQKIFGIEGNSTLKSDLKELLNRIPNNLEYQNYLAQIEIEKQRKRISQLQLQLNEDAVEVNTLAISDPSPNLTFALDLIHDRLSSSTTIDETESECTSSTLEISQDEINSSMDNHKNLRNSA